MVVLGRLCLSPNAIPTFASNRQSFSVGDLDFSARLRREDTRDESDDDGVDESRRMNNLKTTLSLFIGSSKPSGPEKAL